jgi:hypothetical protein
VSELGAEEKYSNPSVMQAQNVTRRRIGESKGPIRQPLGARSPLDIASAPVAGE